MNQFNPTNRIELSDPAPDQLATSMLDALTRPLYYEVSWGVAKSFLMSVATIGVIPAACLVGWTRLVFAQHEQQLWHLAEWMRINAPDSKADELQKTASLIKLNQPLAVISGACTLVALALLLKNILSAYSFAFHFPETSAQLVVASALTVAAISSWVHILWHQKNMNRYVNCFNELAARHQLSNVPVPPIEFGLHPLWLLAGITLTAGGAIWGLPLMLAMGAHRRYTMITSVRLRAMLAERLRDMLGKYQPEVPLQATISIVRACNRTECQAPLKSDAVHCPKCGMTTEAAMELVA